MSKHLLRAGQAARPTYVRVQRGRIVVRVAIPPMHPATPSPIRVRVFELALTGRGVEAYDLARDFAETLVEGDNRVRAYTRAVIAQRPNGERGSGLRPSVARERDRLRAQGDLVATRYAA